MMLNRLSENDDLVFFLTSGGIVQCFPISMMNIVEFLPYTCVPYWHSELEGSTRPQDWKLRGWANSYHHGWSCNRDFMGLLVEWIKVLALGYEGLWECWEVVEGKAGSERRRQGLGEGGHSHQSQDCLWKNPWAGGPSSGHRTKDSVARIRGPFLTSVQIRFRVYPVCVLLYQMWSKTVTGLSLGLSAWLFWMGRVVDDPMLQMGDSWIHFSMGFGAAKILTLRVKET